jgi:hypothetical protein
MLGSVAGPGQVAGETSPCDTPPPPPALRSLQRFAERSTVAKVVLASTDTKWAQGLNASLTECIGDMHLALQVAL